MSWVHGVSYLDSLVREYLKFRGFSNASKTFESDLKADRDKLNKADRVVQRLLHCIHTYDFEGLMSNWFNLKQEYFCYFGSDHEAVIEKFTGNLSRLYMVHAVQNSKYKELQSFLQKMAMDFKKMKELNDWHAVAFSQATDSKSALSLYFTKQWSETFLVSLHNLLATIFSCMPEPELVRACTNDGKRISELEKENEDLSAKLSNAELQNYASVYEVAYVKALGIPNSLSRDRSLSDLSKVDAKATSSKMVSKKDNLLEMYQPGYSVGMSPSKLSSPSLKHSSEIVKDDDFDVCPNNNNILPEPDIMMSDKKVRAEEASTSTFSSSPAPTAKETSDIQANITSRNDDIGLGGLYCGAISKAQSGQQPCSSETVDISYTKSVMLKDQEDVPFMTGMSSDSGDAMSEFTLDFSPDYAMPSVGRLEHPVVLPKQMSSSIPKRNNPFLILSRGFFHEHVSPILQCKFDNTGAVIGSVDDDGVVKVWQTEPRVISMCTLRRERVKCLEWCARPTDIILLGTRNGTIELFNTAKEISLEDVAVDELSEITNIRTNPVDASFATSLKSSDAQHHSPRSVGLVMVWDIQSSQVRLEQKLKVANHGLVTCMDYNHNGNLLVAGDTFGHITLYDMKSYSIVYSRQAHEGMVCSVQFSSDETLIFSLGRDNELRAWNLNHLTNPCFKFHFDDIGASLPFILMNHLVDLPKFVLSPEGKHLLVSAGNKGVIYEINTTTHTLSMALALPEQKTPLTALDWIANNTCNYCLTGSEDGKIQVTTLLLER